MYSLSVYSNRNEKKNINLSNKKMQKNDSKIIEKERIEEKINIFMKNKENKKNKKGEQKSFMFGIRDDKIKKLKDFDKKYIDKVIDIF